MISLRIVSTVSVSNAVSISSLVLDRSHGVKVRVTDHGAAHAEDDHDGRDRIAATVPGVGHQHVGAQPARRAHAVLIDPLLGENRGNGDAESNHARFDHQLRGVHAPHGVVGDAEGNHDERHPQPDGGQRLDPAMTVGVIVVGFPVRVFCCVENDGIGSQIRQGMNAVGDQRL
jgi:hypothetical protein